MRPCPIWLVGACLIHMISIPDRGVAERRKRKMIGHGVREAIIRRAKSRD